MPIKFGRDHNWLANMRDPEMTVPFADERTRERTKRLHHYQIADEIATQLPKPVCDELTDDDFLALGKRVFETVGGEHQWEELRKEQRISAIEHAAETEGLRPADAVIAATVNGMIANIGEEQIETWVQQMADITPP